MSHNEIRAMWTARGRLTGKWLSPYPNWSRDEALLACEHVVAGADVTHHAISTVFSEVWCDDCDTLRPFTIMCPWRTNCRA